MIKYKVKCFIHGLSTFYINCVLSLLEYLTRVTYEKIHFDKDLQNIIRFIFTSIVLTQYTFTLEIISGYNNSIYNIYVV